MAVTLFVISWIHNVLFRGHALDIGSMDQQCIQFSVHVVFILQAWVRLHRGCYHWKITQGCKGYSQVTTKTTFKEKTGFFSLPRGISHKILTRPDMYKKNCL